MSSVLRQRVPWYQSYPTVATEGVELEELGETTGLLTEFTTTETAAAALDSTGVGAPLGIIIGLGSLAGLGIYELYEHTRKRHNLSWEQHEKAFHKYSGVAKIIQKHQQEQQKQEFEVKPLSSFEESSNLNIVPLENVRSEGGFVIPGTTYIGPGNTVDPVNPAYATSNFDWDAFQHDIDYLEAVNNNQIEVADTKFINRALDHIAEGLKEQDSYRDFILASIGGIGIKFKQQLEKLTGPLYPSMSGKCQNNIDQLLKGGLTLVLKITEIIHIFKNI